MWLNPFLIFIGLRGNLFAYIIRRLILLPLTLFCILLVNFVIINLAPGDPTTVTEISAEGASRKAGMSEVFGSDSRYLQFREHYGLTLPILYNNWPSTTLAWVEEQFAILRDQSGKHSFKELQNVRTHLGDRAKFILPLLAFIMKDNSAPLWKRSLAARFFIRGATRQGFVGPSLTPAQHAENKKIADDNLFLLQQAPIDKENEQEVDKKIENLLAWNTKQMPLEVDSWKLFFFETRFFRYFTKVITLDFGTLRSDDNKTVISEVSKRFKYSLTLSIIPMLLTFFFSMVLGLIMAAYHNRWMDHSLNALCLVLYAIPIFVVAPFLIEKVSQGVDFPFTHTPIPFNGFTSTDAIYTNLISSERFLDVLKHIALPLVVILYGGMAAQARLARTATLEVLRQDYIRTAKAKGVSNYGIYLWHVGRNASITIVTSIATSLGMILGGSLIVETLFEIDGFGKFFYEAVLNRDYNVILFSALSGAFLSLLGYLLADVAYTVLDPRVTLE